MSKEAFVQFYQAIFKTEELKEKIRAMTSTQELIKLGSQYGYCFTREDIAEVSNSYVPDSGKEVGANNSQPVASKNSGASFSPKGSQFYHYEFEFSEIPGFEEIAQELDKLKIKPSTVDLNLYEKSFREDDFNFASLSPASPEFQLQYSDIMEPCFNPKLPLPEPEYTQRHFHLINLDLHLEHPLYEEYLMRKVSLVKRLEKFFDAEIRFSGSLWYPPKAYRVWHTNENQPGWRMYLIDFDAAELGGEGQSFFRYMNPETKELVTLPERPKLVRFFKIEQDPSKLFWHCIVNATKFNRWSFGFEVPDSWMSRILSSRKHTAEIGALISC
ncbi:Nif11-like leader peptide family natural product precursor [Kamptonema formosum]|uniref:Nif11-like leader peptide family natural product precursor n=1 Tax=Kamptonema formosum TaxID=331992 RepID=UPI0003469FB9|nr:Nif11-like leader peptide family natural product precursor [Oscillatoria sp. PCC 10802]